MPETKRPLKVFLCYANTDSARVRDLYSRLKRAGVDVWLDKVKLLPGQDWELEIRRAVREADVVVVCLSKQFNLAGFRQKEVRLALDTAMEQPEGEIFIIPARLEECDTLESLRKWQWVDLYEVDGYQRLILALRVRADKINATLRVRRSGKSTTSPPKSKETEIAIEPLANAGDFVDAVPGNIFVDDARETQGNENSGREAADKMERENAEREAAEKFARERAEREVLEKATREKAAREKLEREATERAAHEEIKLEGAEKAKREKIERQSARKAAPTKTFSNTFNLLKSTLLKARLFLRIIGIVGIIIVLFWAGSRAIPILVSLLPTAKATATQHPLVGVTSTNPPVVPTKTQQLNATSTKTETPAPTSLPTEITDAKGVKMELVPAGNFIKGVNQTQKDSINQDCLKILFLHVEYCSNLLSQLSNIESIFLESFYIDKYEVANAQYKNCVQAGACSTPIYQYFIGPYPSYKSYYDNPSYADYPVIADESLAKEYCEWRGTRLPIDTEWEKAARGTDGRLYPWGNTFDCHKGNFDDTGWAGQPTVTGGLNCDGYVGFSPVNAFPNGVSPYNILNMAGNAAELAVFTDGSGWSFRGGDMRSSNYTNFSYLSALRSNYGESGFRCARSVP